MAKRLIHFLPALARLRRRRRARSPGVVTALDIDGTVLRVAQAANRTQLRLVATATLDIPANADRNDPLVVGMALSRALAKLQLKPASVIMGIPRARVVLRTLTVPVIDKIPELASLVHFQVTKDLPFRPDEAVIDFKVGRHIAPLPEKIDPAAKPDGPAAESARIAPRQEVLVAVVKRDFVDYHLRLAEAAGLKLSALGLLPYANARCVEACQVADGDEAFALVLLRPDEASIDIIAQQSLLFSRGAAVRAGGEPANGGGAAPSPEEAFVQTAVIEVIRSLHAYAGIEANRTVRKVVVAGATGHENVVTAALGSRLVVPCTQLDPAGTLRLPPDSQGAAAGSIGVIGLALGHGDAKGLPFDFLNPKRPAVERNLQRIRILLGAAAAAVFMMMMFGLRAYLVGKRTSLLTAASAELSQAEKKRPIYRQMINQSGVVDDWVKGGRDWLEHYAYLTSVLPPSDEIYLTSLAISGQGAIRLGVQARSGETLARLDRQLRSAGYEVKPIAITPGSDRFGYDFRSTVELIVPDKLKIDLKKVRPSPRPLDDISLEPKAWKRGGS